MSDFFDFWFSKRIAIPVAIIVLTATGISALIQIFLIDTPQKRRHKASSNSNIVKYNDFVSDTICDIETGTFQKYLFCSYKKGCYFGRSISDVEDEINSFIYYGETILKKSSKSSMAYFINDDDTLIVKYKVYPNNGVLYEGEIVK